MQSIHSIQVKQELQKPEILKTEDTVNTENTENRKDKEQK